MIEKTSFTRNWMCKNFEFLWRFDLFDSNQVFQLDWPNFFLFFINNKYAILRVRYAHPFESKRSQTHYICICESFMKPSLFFHRGYNRRDDHLRAYGETSLSLFYGIYARILCETRVTLWHSVKRMGEDNKNWFE